MSNDPSQGTPDAWLVTWCKRSADAGTLVYTDEKEARAAAHNIQAYSTSETTADVLPLYALPSSPQSDAMGPSLETLDGQIAAIYGSLDAGDCAFVDHEWARMRGLTISPSPVVSETDFANWFIRTGCTGMSVMQTAQAVLRDWSVTPRSPAASDTERKDG